MKSSDRSMPGPEEGLFPAPDETRSRPPCVRLEHRNGVLRAIFSGDWQLGVTPQGLPDAPAKGWAASARKRGKNDDPFSVLPASASALELTADNLGTWDSSLLAVCVRLRRAADARGIAVTDTGLPEGVRNLVRLALTVPPTAGAKSKGQAAPLLAVIGDMALTVPKTARHILDFLGETVLAFGRLLRGKSACTPDNVWLCLQEASIEALPIVSLISLLVGFILAFVGVVQLRMFGAEIYVSSLVAIGMTRIMGAIMTGIILAGRTGASYAAVLGTMQVNEEIDALTTLGVPPSDYLLLPRVIALTTMTPLLVLYADIMGILGGFVVGVGILGLDPMEYYTFTQKGFGLSNLWVGIVHGAVFGLVIALTGCYQGLRCGRSAEAVGTATTRAVVFSIVGIVLSTAVLTLLCNVLKV